MSSSKSAKRKRRLARRKKIIRAATNNGDDMIVLQGTASFDEDSLTGKCDDGKKKRVPTFSLVAYNGGKMKPGGYGREVVVELSGVGHDGRVPVFLDHEVSGKGIVGHAVVSSIGAINAEGVVSGDTEAASVVVESAKKGFPWQASIGASVDKRQVVKAGETRVINGQQFSGPFEHIVKSRLHEISFVPIGADTTTSATIAAQLNRSNTMPEDITQDDSQTTVAGDDTLNATGADKGATRTFDKTFIKWIEANGFDPEEVAGWDEKRLKVVRAAYDADQKAKEDLKSGMTETELMATMRQNTADEIERQNKIRDLCKFNAELCAQAIRDDWTVEKTELELLRIDLSKGPKRTFGARQKFTTNQRVIEAAICAQTGCDMSWLDSKADHWKKWGFNRQRGYTEQELDAASDLGEYTFGRLMHEFLYSNGMSVSPGLTTSELIPKVRDAHRTLRASTGFSTVSISGILSNVMGKRMLEMYQTVEPVAQRISSNRPVSDFKETKAFRMSGVGDFLEVGPTGELKNMELTEEEYAAQPITYGRLLTISRNMLINDDLGALSAVTTVLGRKAGIKLQKVFFDLWLGLTFFTAGNGNLVTSAALSIANLTSVEQAFLTLKDAGGDFISVMPQTLLVPPGIKVTAEQIMASTGTLVAAPGATGANQATYNVIPETNPHVGKWAIETTPYLQDSTLSNYVAADATSYYLLAPTNIAACAEIVYLNGRQTPYIEGEDSDFSTLGFQWRAYFDFGVAAQDYRGGVKAEA